MGCVVEEAKGVHRLKSGVQMLKFTAQANPHRHMPRLYLLYPGGVWKRVTRPFFVNICSLLDTKDHLHSSAAHRS